MKEDHDREQGYCRKLGHHLCFGYCRRVNQGLPCALVRDCWFERFPVAEFLAASYSEEELARASAPAPSKLVTILAAATRAQVLQRSTERQSAADR
jgi:hypothetical protein